MTELSNKGGWFAVTRALLNDPHFKPEKPFSNLDAWLWLLNAAAYQPVSLRGQQTRGRITLTRGEFAFAVRFLAHAWGWDKCRVHRELALHEKEGRLKRLDRDGNVVFLILGYDLRRDADRDASETPDPLENSENHSPLETPTETELRQRENKEQGNYSLHKEPVPEGAPADAPDGADLSVEQLEQRLAELYREQKQTPLTRPMSHIWQDIAPVKAALYRLNHEGGK